MDDDIKLAFAVVGGTLLTILGIVLIAALGGYLNKVIQNYGVQECICEEENGLREN